MEIRALGLARRAPGIPHGVTGSEANLSRWLLFKCPGGGEGGVVRGVQVEEDLLRLKGSRSGSLTVISECSLILLFYFTLFPTPLSIPLSCSALSAQERCTPEPRCFAEPTPQVEPTKPKLSSLGR